MRNGDFDVVLEANCHGMVNPLLDRAKVSAATVSSENYGNYEDPAGGRALRQDAARDRPGKQRELMRQFEKYVLDDQAHMICGVVVVPDRAVPVLREGLEDQPEALHQPGSGDHLARQIERR